MAPDRNDQARPQPAAGATHWRQWRRTAAHWVRVVVAMVVLAATAVAQRFIPMPRWSGVLGRPTAVPEAWRASPVLSLPSRWDSLAERRAARAVRSAGRYLPWKPRCLPEATAAQVLLRTMRSPAVVVIGLRPPPQGDNHQMWEAHAWLVGRSGAITGGPAAQGFTATTVFEVPGGPTAAEVAAGNTPD